MLDDWSAASDVFRKEHGWHNSSVRVPLLKTGASYTSEDDVPHFTVEDVHHRSLLDLIVGVISDKSSRFANGYHWIPNRMYWTPPPTESDESDSSSWFLAGCWGRPSEDP